ncbi:peroxiredoxin [Amaricoccus macauensis]|uniref:peroxiredoxin n=1 Tax=Amaricoccus macauensis TaxID=57001 RepID=UPI003C7C9EBE
MAIEVGDRLPESTFLVFGSEGPKEVPSGDVFSGRKVVVFAVPGAYTPTCTKEHVPSFVKAAEALSGKGVDEIVCISVNDPFVMSEWGESTGATSAGIRMLADPKGDFTSAIGLAFDAPPAGLFGRSKRYSMLVEDTVVSKLNIEPATACTISGGETILEQI